MKKKMKANGSNKPSLSSMMSSLYDSIDESHQLISTRTMDGGELSITGLLAIGETLKSIELQLQAIRDLLRQRKEAIPKGKISSFFNFATLSKIKMTKSKIDTLQGPISRLTGVYMIMARTLHPELFSDDTNICLIQEEPNNSISPEVMVLSPSPTEEDIGLNNKLQNEPEPLRSES
ncbi:PREDICTED: uncharacterized protein LOC104712205 [Camelina sativa]|uniref:Uncharacterized protein LOC104712205 n=1 Tax=Camelina sativa TaxID=90675 RepID=A0ABM1QGI5_CAMSA|nr:PREDICTED: uncharacterized protein LOC104712205 [Camelina sativa]